MTEKLAAVMDKVHPDLLEPPHIVGNLIDIMNDERQIDLFQQEQLVAHLVECEYCRTTIIIVLSAALENEQSNDHPDPLVYDLLTRLVDIHHEIKSREYEQMGAYAEAIVAHGKKEANRHFPALVDHIRTCSRCQITLEETLAFLNESDEGD